MMVQIMTADTHDARCVFLRVYVAHNVCVCVYMYHKNKKILLFEHANLLVLQNLVCASTFNRL